MHRHCGNFVRFCMRSDCCGCCQNKQDGGWQISLLRRKTGWVFANFLKRWLHYKVNNQPITKNKTDLSCSECKPMKGLDRTSPFHQFTNPRCDKSVYFWSWGSHLPQFTCLNRIIDNGGSVVSFWRNSLETKQTILIYQLERVFSKNKRPNNGTG